MVEVAWFWQQFKAQSSSFAILNRNIELTRKRNSFDERLNFVLMTIHDEFREKLPKYLLLPAVAFQDGYCHTIQRNQVQKLLVGHDSD